MKRTCVCCGKEIPEQWIESIEQFREVCTDCGTSLKSSGTMNKIGGTDCIKGMADLAGAIINRALQEYEVHYKEAINEACTGVYGKSFRDFKKFDKLIHSDYYYGLSLGMIDGAVRGRQQDVERGLPESKKLIAKQLKRRLER